MIAYAADLDHHAPSPEGSGTIRRLLVQAAISGFLWLVISRLGSSGQWIAVPIALGLGAFTLLLAAIGDTERLMPALAYLLAVEPCIRKFAQMIGYLYIEYLVVAIALLALLRRRGRWSPWIPLLAVYFVLELADFQRITTSNYVVGGYRNIVFLTAAKLGLLVLGARINWDQCLTASVLRALLTGTLTIAGIVLASTVSGQVRWGTQANFVSSGNMGPNQVALMLAFGAYAALVLADRAGASAERTIYFALMGLQIFCSLVTFTRGGVVAIVICIAVYTGSQTLRRPKSFSASFLIVAVIAGAVWSSISLTDSMIIRRYEKKGTSGRDLIAQGAWEIFLDNPMIGIGAGNFYSESATRQILRSAKETGAHNELMRALAEHGLIGFSVFALFLLTTLRRACDNVGQTRTIAFLWWFLALFSEIHSGLKLAVQPLLLVLALEAFRDGWTPEGHRPAHPFSPYRHPF